MPGSDWTRGQLPAKEGQLLNRHGVYTWVPHYGVRNLPAYCWGPSAGGRIQVPRRAFPFCLLT